MFAPRAGSRGVFMKHAVKDVASRAQWSVLQLPRRSPFSHVFYEKRRKDGASRAQWSLFQLPRRSPFSQFVCKDGASRAQWSLFQLPRRSPFSQFVCKVTKNGDICQAKFYQTHYIFQEIHYKLSTDITNYPRRHYKLSTACNKGCKNRPFHREISKMQ